MNYQTKSKPLSHINNKAEQYILSETQTTKGHLGYLYGGNGETCTILSVFTVIGKSL